MDKKYKRTKKTLLELLSREPPVHMCMNTSVTLLVSNHILIIFKSIHLISFIYDCFNNIVFFLRNAHCRIIFKISLNRSLFMRRMILYITTRLRVNSAKYVPLKIRMVNRKTLKLFCFPSTLNAGRTEFAIPIYLQ